MRQTCPADGCGLLTPFAGATRWTPHTQALPSRLCHRAHQPRTCMPPCRCTLCLGFFLPIPIHLPRGGRTLWRHLTHRAGHFEWAILPPAWVIILPDAILGSPIPPSDAQRRTAGHERTGRRRDSRQHRGIGDLAGSAASFAPRAPSRYASHSSAPTAASVRHRSRTCAVSIAGLCDAPHTAYSISSYAALRALRGHAALRTPYFSSAYSLLLPAVTHTVYFSLP